jgi:hypothetical protein
MNVSMLLVICLPETKWNMMSPQFRIFFLCGSLVCGSVNMQNYLRCNHVVILVDFILWERG